MYQAGKGIRGGVPVVFPRFGPDPTGALPQHGFARTSVWTVAGVGVADDEARAAWVRFELVDITSRHSGLPSRLRLAWYGGPVMQAGERWRLAAKLKRPRGLVNPHPFDYEAWLLARRIGASGTIKAGERLSAAEGELAWRDQLRQRLLAVV